MHSSDSNNIADVPNIRRRGGGATPGRPNHPGSSDHQDHLLCHRSVPSHYFFTLSIRSNCNIINNQFQNRIRIQSIHSIDSSNVFVSIDSFIPFVQLMHSFDSFHRFIQLMHSIDSFSRFHSVDSFNRFEKMFGLNRCSLSWKRTNVFLSGFLLRLDWPVSLFSLQLTRAAGPQLQYYGPCTNASIPNSSSDSRSTSRSRRRRTRSCGRMRHACVCVCFFEFFFWQPLWSVPKSAICHWSLF